MEKKLLAIGNSVALIIDKPLRNILGIKPTTIVRVMTDGRRLIIEPCGEHTKEAKQNAAVSGKLEARAIAQAFTHGYQISNACFERLSAGWRGRFGPHGMRYAAWIDHARWEELTEAEHRVIRRLAAVYRALQKGASWDSAIRVALEAEPFDPDDPTEHDVGRRHL